MRRPVCAAALHRRFALACPPALLLLRGFDAAFAQDEFHVVKLQCGASLRVPARFVTASDRPNAGSLEATLALIGDFTSVDTVSLRRELPPAGLLDAWDNLSADEVAERLTAAERASVAGNKATSSVAGVSNSGSGTISFQVLSSSRAPNGACVIETRQAQCRGCACLSEPLAVALTNLTPSFRTVTEGLRGAKLCAGPRGDELAIITRHAVSLFVPRRPYVYALRASCVEERWQLQEALLRDVIASFDGSGLGDPF